MRYILIDRYLELVKGEYGRAVKTITHCEAFLDTGSSPHPVFPGTLLMEAQAQVAGILAAYTMEFRCKSVLGKLDRAEFGRPVGPGDRLDMVARIEGTVGDSKGENFLVQTEVEVDGERVASTRTILAALDLESPEGKHFDTNVFKREREDLFRVTGVLHLLEQPYRDFIASGF